MMKRKAGSAACDDEFDSAKVLNSPIHKMHKEHSETFHNANTTPKLELNNFHSSVKKIYKIDESNENPDKHVTIAADNVMLSVKCEEHTAMETNAIERRYIPQEVENEKCITLPNKNIKEEPIATDNLTSIQDGLIVEQLEFIKNEVLETNTEQQQLENEVYTVRTLRNENIEAEPNTTAEYLVNGIIGDQISFEGDVAVQDFVKDEPRTEHLLLDNEMYTIITIENENIKMKPEASLSETPHGANINDQNSFEDEISETSTEQLLLENEEYTIIKTENESIKTKPETSASETTCGATTDDRSSFQDCVTMQKFMNDKVPETRTEQLLLKNDLEVLKKQKSTLKGEQRFNCDICGKKFPSLGPLKVHRRFHTGEKPYSCTECDQSFPIKSSLNLHMVRHTGEKPYTCTECDQSFAIKNSLKRHMKRHTGEKPYTCAECNQSFSSKSSLNLHMRRHTGEKPYTCTECNQSFTIKETLLRHMKRHTGEKPYKCTECDKCFIRKVELDIHIRQHTGEKPYTCIKCNQSFTAKQSFYHHMKRHTGEKPYTCTECNQSFFVKESLNRHMRQHTGEKPFTCTQCNQCFTRKQGLDIHIRRHAGVKPYTCIECNKTFAIKRELSQHMRRHTGEKPYTCTECNQSFSMKSSLNLHKKRHTGEKPYSCNECNKTFAVKEALSLHMKRHTGEKPYVCKDCGKRFIRGTELRSHSKTHIRPYACDQCEQKFKTIKQLEQHTRIHSSIRKRDNTVQEQKFKYKEYNSIYATKKDLKTFNDSGYHIDLEEGEKYDCSVCNKEFDSIKTLNSHIFATHEDYPEVFTNAKRVLKSEINSSDSSLGKIYENDITDENSIVKNIATTKNNVISPEKYTDPTLIEGSGILQEFIKEELPETSTDQFLLENEIYTDITVENEYIKMEPKTSIP